MGSHSKGCRCTECKAKNNKRQLKLRMAYYAIRIEVDGRLIAPGKRTHGKRFTYMQYGCRCELCNEANNKSVRYYRAKAK